MAERMGKLHWYDTVSMALHTITGNRMRSLLLILAALTRDQDLDVRFIERMPMGGVAELGSHVSSTRILERIGERFPIEADPKDDPRDAARRYRSSAPRRSHRGSPP